MTTPMTLSELSQTLDPFIALTFTVPLQPADGPRAKFFPPTYHDDATQKGIYAIESRYNAATNTQEETVLVDSIASQANRMEQLLEQAIQTSQPAFFIPHVTVDLRQLTHTPELPARASKNAPAPSPVTLDNHGIVTSINAPHRIADAILLDSCYQDIPFPTSRIGTAIAKSTPNDANAIFGYSPTSLLFGVWLSHAKPLTYRFPRAIRSEITAWGHVTHGVKVSSRIDPLNMSNAVVVDVSNASVTQTGIRFANPQPKPNKKSSLKPPSEIGHGNIAPTIDTQTGGIQADSIQQTAVLSLAQIRQYHFPDANQHITPDRDHAAQQVLITLGLLALAIQYESGYLLRSGCLLQAFESPEWQGIGTTRDRNQTLTALLAQPLSTFIQWYNDAVEIAQNYQLPWASEPIPLTASKHLIQLIYESDRSRQKHDNESDETTGS